MWLVGMLAIIGGYTFAFVYHQLNLLANRSVNYGFLHTLTRWLYPWMPLSLNLVALGALVNHVSLALEVWAATSVSCAVVAFSVYYNVERGLRRAT